MISDGFAQVLRANRARYHSLARAHEAQNRNIAAVGRWEALVEFAWQFSERTYGRSAG